MEMWLGLNHLQCSNLVRAVHVEPEAQVTQADTGWKWTPGRHLGDVPLPLNGRVYVEEFPPATFEAQSGSHLYINSREVGVISRASSVCLSWDVMQ